MKDLRRFDIDIYNLSSKKHYYDYDLDNSFFENFEDSFIHIGLLKANVVLDKSETLIQANIKIQGTVQLTCDRSLEEFDYQVIVDENLIFKFSNDYQELTDEIITIPVGTQKLNLAQYIYEYIGLSVPMKKLHPRFLEEESEENEDEEVKLIYSTTRDVEEEDLQDEVNDPRWEILNKLKNNKIE